MATRVLPLVAEVGTELCRVKLEGGSLGGYKCEILTENLSEREINTYKCPRCEGIMKDGVISNTGEQLCICCLGEEQSHFNAPIRSTILSLKCSCPLSIRGCEWLGSLESVDHHLTTCGRVLVSCKLRCDVVTSRDEMGRHVREECSQREEACLHCSGVHTACEMEEHVKVCGKVAVMCELGCGTRVCRESISCHRESECPEETVVCPYERYRCGVMGLLRRELNQHMEENRMVHMELKLIAFDEKFDIILASNESLRKQIQVLNTQMETKENEIAFLTKELLIKQEAIVKFTIKNIINRFKPNQKFRQARPEEFVAFGYRFCFCYNTDNLNFNIHFDLLVGDNYNSLECPRRAIFITRMVCHRDTKQSLIMKSSIIEIRKVDHTSKPICSIPLSTDMNNFIREDRLDFEITVRVLKNR